MKQLTVPIKGMHCKSCEVLLTDELESLSDVKKADVSLKTKSATLFVHKTPPRKSIERAVTAAGYSIGFDEKPLINKNPNVYKDLAVGIVVVAIFGLLFAKLGLGNIASANIGGASAGSISLMVGLAAGFSTCMALIGGLVLGVSSRYAEKHPDASPMQKFRPHVFFNIGRIVSFVAFGALIGLLGSAFQLKGSLLGFLTLAAAFIMLMLGLQLTELFPRLKAGFTLPGGIAKFLKVKSDKEREYSHNNSMLLGAATFFLPCGFTQAMQLYAVSTGSPVIGAIIMGAFALGTTPGLLSIGGLTSVVKGAFAQRFFRITGVVVVVMAFVNIANAANLMGVSRWPEAAPRAAFQAIDTFLWRTSGNASDGASTSADAMVLKTTYNLSSDIVPRDFTTKVGQKTVMQVNVKQSGQGCMSTIMIPGLDDTPQFLQAGKTLTLSFTPKNTGLYQITCAMGVPRGTIRVTL